LIWLKSIGFFGGALATVVVAFAVVGVRKNGAGTLSQEEYKPGNNCADLRIKGPARDKIDIVLFRAGMARIRSGLGRMLLRKWNDFWR